MLDRFGTQREVPIAARRRAWLLTVAHFGHKMADPAVQNIMAKWVAKGDLPQEDWDVIERIAKSAMNKHRQ